MNLVIAFGIMLVLYVIFVIIFARNEYIGDVTEIETRLGIVVLGDIPDANSAKTGDGYYYRARNITEKIRNDARGNNR